MTHPFHTAPMKGGIVPNSLIALKAAYGAYAKAADGAGALQPRVVQSLIEAVYEVIVESQAGPMNECAICGDYSAGGVEVHELCLADIRGIEVDGPLDRPRLARALEQVPESILELAHLTDSETLAAAIAEQYDHRGPAPLDDVRPERRS